MGSNVPWLSIGHCIGLFSGHALCSLGPLMVRTLSWLLPLVRVCGRFCKLLPPCAFVTAMSVCILTIGPNWTRSRMAQLKVQSRVELITPQGANSTASYCSAQQDDLVWSPCHPQPTYPAAVCYASLCPPLLAPAACLCGSHG